MNKSALALVGIGSLVLVSFFATIYFQRQSPDSWKKPPDDKAAIKLESAVSNDAEVQAKAISAKEPDSGLPKEIERMNAIQKEYEALTDSEVISLADHIKATIYQKDLVNRLNKDLVNEQERQEANDLLLRLALLGVEKGKRGLHAIKPEIKNALKKHEEDMAALKDSL